MAVLVRWRTQDDLVTLRASASEQHPYLPNHVRLVGVLGVADPEHPDLRVTALNIRKDDIEFMCEAQEAQGIPQQQAAPVPAAKPPAVSAAPKKPPPPPKR